MKRHRRLVQLVCEFLVAFVMVVEDRTYNKKVFGSARTVGKGRGRALSISLRTGCLEFADLVHIQER